MASSSGNEDALTIPRAAINKMIKETLPNLVANDARELVVNYCTEFIHLVSSEANEICNKSEKKTISPEHVIQAPESLGSGSYISQVKEVLQECKTVALKRRKTSSCLENLGTPEEELLRQQQELFAKARQQQAALHQQEWLQETYERIWEDLHAFISVDALSFSMYPKRRFFRFSFYVQFFMHTQ
ncbi:LOW QUALITY PROTEIN: protein Dr1-like [Panthera pardus]|uniref:Protein Dr1 n=1 Tax=Panthera pardus TaxID=9691 RepID=A0A9W2UY21_PANPR|nr:LOW QUALITY PROTEIN: protein Dr1-like [Panthera pardus]